MPYFKLRKLLNVISSPTKAIKILVIRNGLIGDTVFITPVIFRLNNNFPNAIIDVVVGYKSYEILQHFPGIQNIFTLPKEFKLAEHIKFFLSLRKTKYDIVLVQELNTHYTLMGKLLGARVLLGYENKLDRILDIAVKRTGHIVYAEQLLVNKIIPGPVEPTILYTTADEDIRAQQILSLNNLNSRKMLVCIQVACSEKDSVRKWQNDKLSELADYIIEKHGAQIIFSGVTSEQDEINLVQKEMKNPSISLAGKSTVRELIAILKKTAFVIGPDTGTLHIANAVGKPVVMYMGFSDPNETGPFDESGLSKIVNVKLDCLPCCDKNPKPSQWEYCKIHRPVKCMELIKLKDMILTVDELISKIGNS